ncbi:hypothetical protein RHS01_07483 [Rhizoctonia solani]|uniref:Transposase family Tnp2 protein n=1 Tax=Rhizoctonia solani TaxID=456999 RepID=A0A8H7IA28_9AGAM|nr:hypothetical protein RHS01_07483 [Rhizoctonia solani]
MQCAGGPSVPCPSEAPPRQSPDLSDLDNQAATISSTSINACHLTDLDTFPPDEHYTPANSCSRPGSPRLGSCSKTYLLQSPRTPPLFESIDNSTQPDELLDLCDNSSADSDSDSDSDDPCLTTCSPCLDVDYFGKYLMNLSVSGATRPAPLPLGNDPLPSDAKEPHHDDPYIEDDNNADTYPDDPDNPDNPDDPEECWWRSLQSVSHQMMPRGLPDLRAMMRGPVCLYLMLTQLCGTSTCALGLISQIGTYGQRAIPPPAACQEIRQMPLTLRLLERRLGMDHSELMRIYPVCPEPTCGKRYTTEQLYQLPEPRCTWNVGERCPVFYTQSVYSPMVLSSVARPNCFLTSLSLLLSVVYCPARPQDPVEWFDDMPANQRFSDISEGWGWRAHATGLTRQFIDGEYVDLPAGDFPLSLARLPLGLSLTLNADGYQANGGNYTAGGSYTSNGVYIVINNLPYFERNLFENTILAMVLPGPTEPKDYAFDQMMEPLIDNLISLSNGVDLPVHNAETGEIQDRRVYANLLVLVVDWIARIKCTGHVGATAEENHCPYCKLRACLLSTGRGYDHEGYDLCDPHEHLQDKHRWLRAEWHKRDDIRNETGTTFTELDRLSGFYAFDNAPTDVMHLVDLGLTEAIKTGSLPIGRVKADQQRLLRLIMIGLYFEAWRVGDSIPDGDIPRGSKRSKHYKAQKANAKAFVDVGTMSTTWMGASLTKITREEVEQGRQLLEQVGTVFTDMNIHLTPSFHAVTHLPDHLYKYGSVYNTSTARFERANQMLINVNKNGHGGGEIEATMAKGFMRRVEPTNDDTATTKLLLQGMRDAPEHKVQRGRLDAILAGDADFLNKSTFGWQPPPPKSTSEITSTGDIIILWLSIAIITALRRLSSASSQPIHSYLPPLPWYGVRYGSANHTQGFGSRYGYIGDQVPVIIQGIYKSTVAVLGKEHKFLAVMVQRFVAPAEPPAFPWNHWDHILGIGAWEYQELQPVEAVPATAFTGLFALSILRCHTGAFGLLLQ